MLPTAVKQQTGKSKKSECSLPLQDLKTLRSRLKNPENSEYLKECFDLIDVDRSGYLDKQEFRRFLTFLLSYPDGFQQQQKTALLKEELAKMARQIDDDTFEVVYNQVDLNKDSQISFDEFRSFLCLTEEEKLFILGMDAEILQNINPMKKDEKTEFVAKMKNVSSKSLEIELTSLSLMTIPKEVLARPQIEKLDLGFNKFVSWPTELNIFGNLKELTLTANKISSFGDVSGLKQLTTLYIIGNKLTSLGNEIFTLKSLNKLDVSNNEIREISPAISLLEELRELNLCGNLLTTLPHEFGMMDNLNALDLSGNKLIEFPSQLCAMKRMMELDLSNNQLTKLPEEFGDMDRLVYVNICDNKIEKIPVSVGKCKYIDKFLLDRNPIRDQEMMDKYKIHMDHWKDCMEKRYFLVQQEKKEQDKKNKLNELKEEQRALKEARKVKRQEKEQEQKKEVAKKVTPTQEKPDPQKEVLKSGLVAKRELADISKCLYKATDISQIILIAKSLRDANLILDTVRTQLPSQYPKQTMATLDANLDQFTRLKRTTIFAVMQIENFFKLLSLNSSDLAVCSNSNQISTQIANILQILQTCNADLRKLVLKAQSKKSLATVSK